MYESFENLSDEKRNRIIEASLREFSEKGYMRASTNEIVKNAGISKGLLFHYFKSKKNLFLYLFDRIVDEFVAAFYEFIDDSSSDIFDRLMSWTMVKFRLYYRKPLEYRFLTVSIYDSPEEIKDDILKRYERISSEVMKKFMENLDLSRFRKDVDINRSLSFIMTSIEAIGNNYIKMYNHDIDRLIADKDKIIDDLKSCINMLKYGIYDK
ncbi:MULTISPECIES: TetR/AcrR family transcriptional regulator [Thermoanaerobacterium]|uniref:Transcriptional regulator, TetR family n=1 Tax=Thermoanaerobacterium xylanolyticum (strain ATCC 49914 / DSM 7097 / LX-11) TaxID=858215 RepID=F6BKP4_THEXL|nr:TetR/AcrR family transcriptional regulator [Thermoanaerobacterium xylanolyticum]AEF18127.1 transcriptional regulator, TetR family [Thermoanaerobacterium xylanolyticum LX-11]